MKLFSKRKQKAPSEITRLPEKHTFNYPFTVQFGFDDNADYPADYYDYTCYMVQACCDALARHIGKLELRCERYNQQTGDGDPLNDQISKLLAKPNSHQTTYEFLYTIAYRFFRYNDSYIWIVRDKKGTPVELIPLTNTVSIYQDDDDDTLLVYGIKLHDNDDIDELLIDQSDIICLHNHLCSTTLEGDGMTPIKSLSGLMNKAVHVLADSLDSGKRIKGVLASVTPARTPDLELAKNEILSGSTDGIIVVDSKFSFTPVSSVSNTLNADTMKEINNMFTRWYGIPESFVNSSYSRDVFRAVYESRIEPFAIYLSQQLTTRLYNGKANRHVTARYNYMHTFSVDQVVAIVQATSQQGLFTRDEYRSMFGYAPLGSDRGGDDLMLAVNNYQPIDLNKKLQTDVSDDTADKVD